MMTRGLRLIFLSLLLLCAGLSLPARAEVIEARHGLKARKWLRLIQP